MSHSIKMSHCCEEEIDLLKKELNSLIDKEKELKENYKHILIENMKKDLLIDSLEKSDQKDKQFESFKDHISSSVLNELRAKSSLRSDDPNFISVALHGLYGNDIGILKKKTLSGRSDCGGKQPISPKKKEILERIFEERLNASPVNDVDELRKNSLSKLIRSALDSAYRKK